MGRRKVKDMGRDQQKAVFANLKNYTKEQLQNKMKSRSSKAKAVDRSINAKNVYDARNKLGKHRWMKHPERYDIKGIDTVTAKRKYKTRISKKQIKIKRRQISKIRKKIEKKKQHVKKAKVKITATEKEIRKEADFKIKTAKREEDKKYIREQRDKKIKEIQEEEKAIEKDIKEQRELEKQKEQEEKNLDKIQEEHVLTKKGMGYHGLSQDTINQIEKLSPKQEKQLVKDVEAWKELRKKGDTSEAREKADSIRKKYDVDSPSDAYFGITGVSPWRGIRDKPPKRTKAEPSPVRSELDNVVKLDRLKKSISGTESKFWNNIQKRADVEREKEYVKDFKGEESDKKKARNVLEKKEIDYLNYKKGYDKYIASKRKQIKELSEDPNVKIKIEKSMRDESNVLLEYKGKYVNATKVVKGVDNRALEELNLR